MSVANMSSIRHFSAIVVETGFIGARNPLPEKCKEKSSIAWVKLKV